MRSCSTSGRWRSVVALLRGAHGASFSTAERQSFSTAMEAVPSWCWEQSLKLFQEIHGILGGMAGMCQKSKIQAQGLQILVLLGLMTY